MQKTVADLQPGDHIRWTNDTAVVTYIRNISYELLHPQAVFAIRLESLYSPRKYTFNAVPGITPVEVVESPRANPWSRRRELTVGQREEMEHTRSPRVAKRIAQQHLKEDPHYYTKLKRCGLIQRKNPYYDAPAGYYRPGQVYCTRCGRREEDCRKYPLRYTDRMCPGPLGPSDEGYEDPTTLCPVCGRTRMECRKYALESTGAMCPRRNATVHVGEASPADMAQFYSSFYADEAQEIAQLERDLYAKGTPAWEYWNQVIRLLPKQRRTRRNVSTDLPLSGKRSTDWYKQFHGVAPGNIDDRTTWVPGEMVLLGAGVDVGYKIKDKESAKEFKQPYVHEFGPAVKIYRRAKPGEKVTRSWRNFPTELRVLGYNIGFSYADKDGEIHEVAGSQSKYLAVTPSGKTLVVVGPKGVEYVMEGGNMRVLDWIYD